MINTIFFDVGNTLRIVIPDAEFSGAAEAELMRLVETTEPKEVFFEKLEANWEKYRKYAKTELLDAGEMELWTQWLLPDYDTELVARHAGRLTRLWRDHDGRREPRPDVKPTLTELKKRGYKLGIIANTITETEIPDWMIHDQVAGLFSATVLSSKVRIRKPDPAIYHLACRAAEVKPEDCAYVGDNPVRDVEGTLDAGFGMMVRIDEPSSEKAPDNDPKYIPDAIIQNIGDLLGLFPALGG